MARSNKYTSINFNHIYEKNVNTAGAGAASSSNPNNATNPTKHPSPATSSPSAFYSKISSAPSNSFGSPNNLYKNQLPSTRANGGRMLVLTLPASKPLSASSTPPLVLSPQTPPTQNHIRDKIPPDPEPESDPISLRPLGRTGTGPSVSSLVIGQERDKKVGDKFVPPHLRPGFAGKEERPGPEVFRAKEAAQSQHQQQQQHHHHHQQQQQQHHHHHHHQQQQQQQGSIGYQGRHGIVERPRSGGNERIRRGVDSDLGLMNRPRSSGSDPI